MVEKNNSLKVQYEVLSLLIDTNIFNYGVENVTVISEETRTHLYIEKEISS